MDISLPVGKVLVDAEIGEGFFYRVFWQPGSLRRLMWLTALCQQPRLAPFLVQFAPRRSARLQISVAVPRNLRYLPMNRAAFSRAFRRLGRVALRPAVPTPRTRTPG